MAENGAHFSLQGLSAARYVWRVSTQGPAASLGLQPEFAHTILKSLFSPAASCEGLSDSSGLEALGPEAAGPGEPVWGYHRIGELPMYILPGFFSPSLSCLPPQQPTVTKAVGIVLPSSGFLVEVRGARPTVTMPPAAVLILDPPFCFPTSFLHCGDGVVGSGLSITG